MPWPPQVGELLPRYDEPVGIEHKLRNYSLAIDHTDGGPKANGFLVMVGIGMESIDYLAHQIRVGIATTPVSAVRPGESDALLCMPEVATEDLRLVRKSPHPPFEMDVD